MRARSALFTLFGDVVRPMGGEAWLSTITAAMGTLGFNPQAVRTALHRMTGESWVEPRRAGRYAAYRLTDRGVTRLDEAAERIYRLRTRPWDGSWRMLVTPGLDEVDGDGELAAELGWIGFGRLEPTVWVSPHDHGRAVEAVLDRMPPAARSAVTRMTARVDGPDDTLAHRAWDLDRLRTDHRAFLDEWTDVQVPTDGEAAFASRLRLVHRWRSFLFADPGLPAAVLPEDWLGQQAAEAFRQAYEALLEPSLAWYGEQREAAAGTAGPTQTPHPVTADPNPFAQGLAAL
ncbi:Phenylacetic acid degradation operon negative regulatory protein paaX [Euzebya pacifica]|uniref:Phenylacetic acid degradation operon negative regulatory protein paaX n=1 Tax=Euzebya pacifica TaxID=1608957 RepID=A0A346XU96_9ACTN|nr:PaaX family transcriptional regulator C-terminal domain-containing protein [Euzebya pacifica]AXV05793.1 Phenylacetic acid degradation operon negative regulatory protein paaX [Euzebya pacifica]